MGVSEPKNILIVGGAGYVGSHTAKLLQKKNYEPVILDDLSTGHHNAAQHGTLVEGSCGNMELVEKVLDEYHIDTVMHFGAKALVGESVEDPLSYYSTNVAQTTNLISAMKNSGAKYFIFSSTCATFGEPKEVPIHEDIDQLPVNPYGRTKLFVEQILKDVDKAFGIKHAILRYFNAAGADPEGMLGEDHDPETHLIPRVIGAALGKNKLSVHGNDYPTNDGSCIRDYVHVNDLADAHILSMEKLWAENKSFDLNLGTEKGSSVLEVIHMVEKVMDKKIPYDIGPRRPGDPPVLVAKSTKAKEVLGWEPKTSLEDIVKTAAAWMQKNPEGYDKN